MTVKTDRPRDLQALFEKAKKDAEKHGIVWSGDINQGQGSGFGFEAKYVVDADSITVEILKRPLLVSKSRIEREGEIYVHSGA